MDFPSDDEYIPTSPPESPIFTSDGGGIFSGSRHFVVAGGTFNNTTKNYIAAPTIPPDIRMIPIGDIDLQRQLQVNKRSGLVRWRGERRCARRVYSAKIDGRTSDMTVAVYQGERAEEEWRRDIGRYSSLRHPNILQLWGGASAGNVHAAVFHGDLVPFKQFVARYDHSPIMSVYILAYYMAEWEQTSSDLSRLSSRLWARPSFTFTLWIRASTGRLSLDFEFPDSDNKVDLGAHAILGTLEINALFEANPQAVAIASLTLEQYHLICEVRALYRKNIVSPSATVSLGSLISMSAFEADMNSIVLVSSKAGPTAESYGWMGDGGEVREDGWTRYRAEDVSGTEICYAIFRPYYCLPAWLSQANHLFHCRRIPLDLDAYVFVTDVRFRLTIPTMEDGAPPGYLFLCPKEAFEAGSLLYKWPDCPAYWSLDPSGVERLSTEDSTRFGFPPFHLTTEMSGWSWDDSVYAGLRQFHQGKGFDPNSQDVARHLGHPLYQVSSGRDPVFAHSDEEDSVKEADDTSQTTQEGSMPVESALEVEERIIIHDEDSAISQMLKFTMSLQLMLMLFVILCSVRDAVW